MKAWQLVGHRRFEFVDVDVPPLVEGQVLVEVAHASICGSDTHLRYDPLLAEELYPLNPGTPCHEVVGTIVESRNDAFRVGRRAIVLPRAVAGQGYTTGGLAQYVASDQVVGLPDEGDAAEWLMCQPAGTVLHAAREWGNPTDRRIAILGQGAIGLAFTMIASRQGALEVIGIDPLASRLERAREVGATAVLDPTSVDVQRAIDEVTGGRGVDIVVDATGAPEGLNAAIELVNRYGLVIGFSLVAPDSVVPLAHGAWMRKGARLIPALSSSSPNPTKAIAEAVALRRRGWFDPGELITHRWTWDRAPEAYEMYSEHRDGVVKVVLEVS